MGHVVAPKSLRSIAAVGLADDKFEGIFGRESISGRRVTAVAGLIAVASVTGAEAQQSNLPPVTVDAPTARPRPADARPNPEQVRARTALRRAARRAQPAAAAPVPYPNAGELRADRNPYADAAAP